MEEKKVLEKEKRGIENPKPIHKLISIFLRLG